MKSYDIISVWDYYIKIVTQLIIFFGIYEITRVNLILALFHGFLYGSLGLASFDIAKAIKQVTVPKETDEEDKAEPNKEDIQEMEAVKIIDKKEK